MTSVGWTVTRATKVLLTTVLLFSLVCVGSVSRKRKRNPNDENRLLVWDIIALLSQFVDWPDLLRFSVVCRQFREVSKVTLKLSANVMITDTHHRDQMISCEDELELYYKSQLYAAIDRKRTLLELEDECLLVRGVGPLAQPGYTGRVFVRRRVKVPFGNFEMTPNNEWIWTSDGKVMNLHNERMVDLDCDTVYFDPPFIVSNEDEADYEILSLWRFDDVGMPHVFIGSCEIPEYCKKLESGMRLVCNPPHSSPVLIRGFQYDSEVHSTCIDFRNEEVIQPDLPHHYHSKCVTNSEPRLLCVGTRTHWFRLINPMSNQVLLSSKMPMRPFFNDDMIEFGCYQTDEECYRASVNRRYALIRLDSGLARYENILNPSQIYDLRTGEMIGPETKGDKWVSEELFHVADQQRFIVRSVHQPRKNIKCVMVDEDGNETPMMDEHFKILDKDDVLLDQRSNEILFVEWEKEKNEPRNKKQRMV